MKATITRIKRKIWILIFRRVLQQKLSVREWIARIEIGNLLASLSTTGLMALGVVPMSLPVIVSLAVILVIIGFVGRYLDSVEDDVERLIVYERHLNEGVVSNIPDSVRLHGVQLKDTGSEERGNQGSQERTTDVQK